MTASTKKQFLNGTHRSVTPRETLNRASAYWRSAGITRVTNVTNLDRIGLPVFQSVRPLSWSNSVSFGKGTDETAACAGAIMESIEHYFAELVADEYGETMPCTELFSDREVDVNTNQVHTKFEKSIASQDFLTPTSSNGLASGNCYEEAVTHAIYEVAERDAINVWMERPKEEHVKNHLNLSWIVNPALKDKLELLQEKSFTVHAFDLTTDTGFPTILAFLVDHQLNPKDSLSVSFGSGTHLSVDIAISRAITEAAQVRLTHIVGARDDIDWMSYEKSSGRGHLIEWFSAQAPRKDPSLIEDCSTDCLNADLDMCLERIYRFASVLDIRPELKIANITPSLADLSVVKVIVPSFSHPFFYGAVDFGENLKRRLARMKTNEA